MRTFALGIDNKLTFTNPLLNGFKMTLAPTRGEFTGSLLLPANGKRATFSGEALGLLLTPDAETAVTFAP